VSDETFAAAAAALDDELDHDHRRCAELTALASMMVDIRLEAAVMSALHMQVSKEQFLKAAESAYDGALAELRERSQKILDREAGVERPSV
jgi:hypothetical protein